MSMCKFRNILFSGTREILAANRPPLDKTNSRYRRAMACIPSCVATLALGLALSGCGSNSKPFASTSSNAALEISPTTLDFGDVSVGTPVCKTILITHPSTAPVQIAQLRTSSSAFSVTAGTLHETLAAGSKMQVQVRYDPGSTTDSTAQLNIAAKTVTSDSVAGTVKLHGKGSAAPAALTGLSCSNPSMIGAGTDRCTVQLSAPAPSGGLAVDLASTNSAVSVPTSVSIPSGTSSVGFTATVAAVSSSLTVTLTATQGTTSKTTSISLKGSSASALAPSVSALSCGTNSFSGAGTTTCTVSLSSAASSAGTNVTVTSSSTAISVPASVTVAAGSSAISFTANVASVTTSQSATLAASADSTSKSFAIQLNAATPVLSLSSTSLAFGNVAVGTAVTKSVTVTSTGTAAVKVNSASVTGTGYTVSGGNFPTTLNPGQAAVLTVQFDPTSANSVTGQLTISSNAPTSTVSLTGTGATSTPTVSAVSCKLTSITGSQADSCTVSLSGSAPTGGVSVGLAANSSA